MLSLKRPMTRLLICVSLWLFAGAMPVALAADRVDEEGLLMAAFIYNFALFTQWPETDTPDAKGAPFALCIAGEDALVESISRLKGKIIKGRPLVIQSFKDAQNATPVSKKCQLLYVARSEKKNLFNLLKTVRGQSVMTLSELPQFADTGGVVELYRENGRIRFMINLTVARKVGLEISPNLLKLATSVIGAESF